MITAAGGVPVLAVPGERSPRVTWDDVEAEHVDVTIFAPCGFDLEGAIAQGSPLLSRPTSTACLGSVYAVDANAHFSRPGPRVVHGVELLAVLLRSGDGDDIPVDRARRLDRTGHGVG
jgi:iron complex transport system substrate-binding protein